jgi:signal transduction histidine kinase
MNALKLMKNKDKKKITLELKRQGEYIVILFNDNGIGLDNEYIDNPEKIFEALETSRVDKHGNQTGTGLGLYLVKTTLEDYADSKISIQPSKFGFSIELMFKSNKGEI